MYLQVTFTLTSWLTGYPILLSAVQRYVPEAFPWMFEKFKVGPPCSSSLLVSLSNTLVQVMLGVGLPVELHNNFKSDPSGTVLSGLTSVRLAGTDQRMQTVKVYSYTNMCITSRQHLYE